MISTTRDKRSNAEWLACAPQEIQDEFLDELSPNALQSLPYLFDFWALPHQVAPGGAWRSWVVLGGRGAGKTRAGAEWVRSMAEGARPRDPGRATRLAIVGETIEQAREVMVFGESGILACSPPDRRPDWIATRKQLVWPNGAVAQVLSAHDPDTLRGPQFDAAWCDEFGCAAVDKGANEPNRFIDAKSSESSLPHYSDGRRDDLMQMQYLTAMQEYWSDGANNPVSSVYGSPMIETARMHAWAWDTRPYPFFPNLAHVWSDGENYERGHWLNGRTSGQSLAAVVAEIVARAGVSDLVTDRLFGLVRGYLLEEGGDARAALQPLMLAHGLDAMERGGVFEVRARTGATDAEIGEADLAEHRELQARIEHSRQGEAEISGRLRLGFIAADADFELAYEEAQLADTASETIAEDTLPMVLSRNQARSIAERWLTEARVARDTVRLALAPSGLSVGAGDVIALDEPNGPVRYRVDRVTTGDGQLLEAVRVDGELYRPEEAARAPVVLKPFVAPVPVSSFLMDLPLLSGREIPHAPSIAVAADPWPGSVAVYASATDNAYQLVTDVAAPTVTGVTETALGAAAAGVIDRGAPLRVRLDSGSLQSVSEAEVRNGANLAAIGDGGTTNWEIFQFTDAVLISPDVYELTGRLRGQAGTDALGVSDWPVGSRFVLLDGGLEQIDLGVSARGMARHLRIGPADLAYSDPSFTLQVEAFDGIGLRPLAPVHLRADRQVSGDFDVTWIRRSRIDADSWQAVDPPLGEDAESYVVRVFMGSTMLREATVSTPAWTYATADQAADGAAGSITIEVAQVSTQFGPGLFRKVQINV